MIKILPVRNGLIVIMMGFLKTRGILCVQILALCVFIDKVQAESIRVGFYDTAPMMIEESNTGVYHDIFEAIERITGESFVIKYYPYARSAYMFDENEIDIDPGSNPVWTKDLPIPGVFTISFTKIVDVIVFRPGKKIPVTHPINLKGQTVGAVRGYFYPFFEEYFANSIIDRYDGTNEIQILAMLAVSRFDQIIINREIAQYWMSQNPSYRQFEIGDVVGEDELMMRVHPNKKYLIPLLNEAIEQMMQSGEMQQIHSKYR